MRNWGERLTTEGSEDTERGEKLNMDVQDGQDFFKQRSFQSLNPASPEQDRFANRRLIAAKDRNGRDWLQVFRDINGTLFCLDSI